MPKITDINSRGPNDTGGSNTLLNAHANIIVEPKTRTVASNIGIPRVKLTQSVLIPFFKG
jgi:hypothetical protein